MGAAGRKRQRRTRTPLTKRQSPTPLVRGAARGSLPETEAGFQEWLRQVAKVYRWLYYHVHDSRRSPSGFPDTVLLKPPSLIWAELKVDDREPSDAQWAWINGLRACGQEVFVWYPENRDFILWRLQRG